jgi:hypothetical protein
MSAARTHRGVTYFATFAEARNVRDTLPGSRIVEYGRGFAVQLRISGPYYDVTAP